MKSYCTQNNGDCETCSLVNYGRDCQNNPLPRKAEPVNKTGLNGFIAYAIKHGVHNGPQTIKALAALYQQHKGSKWDTIIELFKARGEVNVLTEIAEPVIEEHTGPGRPRATDKRINRSIKMSDAEWAEMTRLAEVERVSVAEYIRRKVLE